MVRRLPVTEAEPGELHAGDGDLEISRPLGLYVHFPFCSVHCPYCDFAVTVRDPIPHEDYADAVLAEAAQRAPWFRTSAAAPRLTSIYFGGGTPGLWRAEALGRVLAGLRIRFGAVDPELEVTVEANPGELTVAHAAALRAVGVNRLSLGLQSFADDQLRALGRNHNSAAATAAVQAARAAGIENLTCDLMFGLPNQTLQDWKNGIARLVALAPDHVSAYALTIESGTPFATLNRAGRLPRPDDDQVAEMFDWGRQALAAAGYAPYEISSYARPGRRSRHNSLYWTGGAYLGLGASAASFRPLRDGSGLRFSNPRSATTYLRGGGLAAPAKIEKREPPDLENEALWLGLRTSEGIDRAVHRQRHGCDPLTADRAAASQRCEAAGWLTVTPSHLQLTPAGLLFADEVASRLWR